MSVLNTIRRWIGIENRKSSLIRDIGGQAVYSDINNDRAVTRGFNTNTAVYSIAMKDAKKFASITRYVYDKNKIEQKANKDNIIEGDLMTLLQRPNPRMGQDAFLARVRCFYVVCGEAFIWLNRGDVAQSLNEFGELVDRSDEAQDKLPVLEMYVVPPMNVVINPDPDNLWGVLGYDLDIDGKKYPIRKNDMIHWANVNLDFDATMRTHLRGRSPLISGYKTLQQNDDATNASVRMYQNDGAKGFLNQEVPMDMTAEQMSKIERVTDRKINNNDVKGAVAVLQGRWKFESVGGSSVDLQLLEGKELSWKELCFLMDMPYEFFDSHTPYAEKQLAQLGWLTNTIIPASKQLDDELNRALLKAFGLENLAFIGCDYADLPEIQQTKKDQAAWMMTVWPIYPNEVREALGYEKHPDPKFDEPWIPSGVTPASETGQDDMDVIQAELAKRGLNDTNDIGSNRGNGKEKISQNGRGEKV